MQINVNIAFNNIKINAERPMYSKQIKKKFFK